MRTLALAVLVAVVALPACSLLSDTGAKESEEIRVQYLTQHWVHSREEQTTSEVQIYRPDDFKEFPASLFRMRYIFYEDGDCKWLFLAPNDGHHFRPGTWRFDDEEKDVIHIEQGDVTKSYRIIELTEDLLRMVQVTTETS